MDLTRIKHFFQVKDESPLYVRSYNNQFIVTHITISKKNDAFQTILYYQVVTNNKEFSFRFPNDFDSIENIIENVYNVLWEYKVCSECLELTPGDMEYCQQCFPTRYFWEYGIKTNKIDSIPTCSICLDNTIGNKLECGHYFHLSCFSRHYRKKDIKCPNCRKAITENDRNTFLLN